MENTKRRRLSLVFTLLICVCAGLGYAWSVFQNPILGMFPSWGASGVSVAFTLQVALSALAPLLFGSFYSKWKTRNIITVGGLLLSVGLICVSFMNSLFMLYLFYGIFAGLGVGMIYTTSMTYAVLLFPEKRGLMSGIVAASYGSGAIIWAPAANLIISGSDVLFCFRLLGALFFVVIVVLSRFLMEAPSFATSSDTQPSKDSKIGSKGNRAKSTAPHVIDKTRADMIRMPVFYLTVGMITTGATAGLMLTSSASPILQSQVGFSASSAAALVGLFAVSNTLGRLFWGTIADKINIYFMTALLFVLLVFSMLSLALFPHLSGLFVAMMFLIYLCYGGITTIISPITADLFGMKNLTSNYGLMYVAYGIGGIVGPRIAATFQSISNSSFQGYTNSFFMAAVLCAVGLVLNFLIRGIIKKAK